MRRTNVGPIDFAKCYQFLQNPPIRKPRSESAQDHHRCFLRKEGKGQFGVKRAATVQLPSGSVSPSFVERNISSPEQFKVLLQEAVVSAGLGGQKSWSVSLPVTPASRRHLARKGTAGKGDAEEILEWKAEQSFGLRPARSALLEPKYPTTGRAGRDISRPR